MRREEAQFLDARGKNDVVWVRLKHFLVHFFWGGTPVATGKEKKGAKITGSNKEKAGEGGTGKTTGQLTWVVERSTQGGAQN